MQIDMATTLGYVRDPKPIRSGRAYVEQTADAMLFIEQHKDRYFKNLTDVGIWKLKRVLEALGKVLAMTIDAPLPAKVVCTHCQAVTEVSA